MCGDGILIYYQCDDGNTLKGDGCSANCIIEDSWNCITVGKKSVCKLKG
jgi:cysteine-rich repeat protein